ncbi:hypothetical protein NEOLI_004916 [Neolecta irregularis DAH-3]|uniref:Uncharacterized protein n=1 Tax=Neolecta irregularis (strain DAH-3) TaxID=1198029 RepID=A0A1U7LKE0_NEOID|nr:hypothetical protein NEOLI_004916 [Neolecta irregularis DAH-3]|eukprot:OLL23109.1 hypothetical protein NEOLI_004916 [Neolecta irregularis DAH-3]
MDSLQLQIPATYPITRPPSPLSDLEADIPVNQLFFDSTIERATDDALRMPAVYPVSRPASPLFDPELGLPVAIESAGPSWLSLLVNFRW